MIYFLETEIPNTKKVNKSLKNVYGIGKKKTNLICKKLGIGNSTGLGMAPFIVNHPTLLNNWVLARETVLKEIREIKKVEKKDSDLFMKYLKKSITFLKE